MTRWWKYLRWAVSIGVGLAVCMGVILYERESYAEFTLFRLISDGCFVAGVVLAGIGAMTWISNLGGFTALSYAVYLVKRKRFSSRKKFEERLSYLEYVQAYAEKEKRRPNCLLLTGALYIAAAFVFLYLYWQ